MASDGLLYRLRKITPLIQTIRVIIFIFPVMLYFVPLGWLSKQQTICLIKNIFGIECFGCGITKAVISAIQLKFADAFEYNYLIVVVFPLLVYLWISFVWKSFKSLRLK